MATLARDVARLVAELQRRGCTVRQTPRGHWVVKRPGVGSVTIGTTPSDVRAWRNILADVRRSLGIAL